MKNHSSKLSRNFFLSSSSIAAKCFFLIRSRISIQHSVLFFALQFSLPKVPRPSPIPVSPFVVPFCFSLAPSSSRSAGGGSGGRSTTCGLYSLGSTSLEAAAAASDLNLDEPPGLS